VPVKCGLKSSSVWTIIHQHADSEVQLSSGYVPWHRVVVASPHRLSDSRRIIQ